MRIEILEEGGIKTQEYGHLLKGDTKTVDDHLGAFYVSNGWAKDLDGNVPTGKRGSLDYTNPAEWDGTNAPKAKAITPSEAKHD